MRKTRHRKPIAPMNTKIPAAAVIPELAPGIQRHLRMRNVNGLDARLRGHDRYGTVFAVPNDQ
jgi:hypothetical protein